MIKRNILANAVGQACSAALSIIAVPLYIHYLGVEAYGLVAFFASLQAILSVLDLGLGTTANREVARRQAGGEKATAIRDLIRTLEAVYAGIGVLIAVLIILASRWIITNWISSAQTPLDTLHLAVIVFAISLGVRWPVSLYTGVLLGAERQVALNAAVIALSVVRTGGAILVIALISPTLLAFLVWYLIANAVEVVVMAALAWSVLPTGDRRARVVPGAIRGIWRFSASISGNSLLAAGLKQGDRLLITRLLPLRFLGYYAAATAAGTWLGMLARPAATAALPRFTALMAAGEDERLADSYHGLSQSVAILVAPFAALFIFFPHDILQAWTRSAEVADHSSFTFAVFGFAYAVNALMQIPFALQLAAGITWIAITNNAISIALLLPLMYVLIQRYGIAGAGVSWALFNVVYFLLIPHVMHRLLLRGHAKKWFLQDNLPFLAGALLIGWGVRAVRESVPRFAFVAVAAITGVVLYALLVWTLSERSRALVRSLLLRRRMAPVATRISLEHPK